MAAKQTISAKQYKNLQKQWQAMAKDMQSAFDTSGVQQLTAALQAANSQADALAGQAGAFAGDFNLAPLNVAIATAGERINQLTGQMTAAALQSALLSQSIKVTAADNEAFAISMTGLNNAVGNAVQSGQWLSALLLGIGEQAVDSNAQLQPLTGQLAQLAIQHQLAATSGWQQQGMVTALDAALAASTQNIQSYCDAWTAAQSSGQAAADSLAMAFDLQSAVDGAAAAVSNIVNEIGRIAVEGGAVAEYLQGQMTLAFSAQAQTAVLASGDVRQALADQGKEAISSSDKMMKALKDIVDASKTVEGIHKSLAIAYQKSGQGFLAMLQSVAGGWVGIAIATAYALMKAVEYFDARNKIKSYDPEAEVYERDGKLYKKHLVKGAHTIANGIGGEVSIGDAYQEVEFSPAEYAEHEAYQKWIKEQKAKKPWHTDQTVVANIEAAFNGINFDISQIALNSNDAQRAWQAMAENAARFSESIKNEWMQTTQAPQQQLDAWREDKLKDLEKNKAAISDYEETKTRIEEIYAKRREKIAEDHDKAVRAIHDKTNEDARGLEERIQALNLPTITNANGGTETSKVAANIAAIDNEFARKKDGIIKKYRDFTIQFDQSTQEMKNDFIKAWEEAGLSFEFTQDGMLTFQKQINKEILVDALGAMQKLMALNTNYALWKEKLESARNAGDLQASIALLNQKQFAEQQSLQARQSMIDTYQAAYIARTATTEQLVADLYKQGLSGLTSAFSDIFMGVQTASEALKSFGQTLIKTVVDYYAAKVAGEIMCSIIGKKNGDKQLSADTKAGIATAQAWIPAAIARTIATAGGNIGPALTSLGIGVTAGMGLFKLPSMATGGLVSGRGTATSDSILTRLSNGEYVVRAAAAKAIGTDQLDAINQGRIPVQALAVPSLATLGAAQYRQAVPYQSAGNATAAHTANGRSWTGAGQPIIIQAIDGKSVERWLENSGGRKIERYFTRRAREFAPVRGG